MPLSFSTRAKLSIFLAIFLTLSSLSWASTTLYTGIVDNGSTNGVSLGTYADVVSDSTGAMHACYYDATNFDLKYSTNSSGKWVSATVDSTGSVGTYCSIGLDSSDKAHISYYDATNLDLKYATNASGTSWAPYSVVSTNSVGTYSSIAVDSSGNVHISYYDSTNADLGYTTGTASTATPWPTTMVDSGGSVGTYSAIAVDSTNYVHISYYDSTNSNLKYATNETGWVTTTVDSSGSYGTHTDIALDSNDYVHISYKALGVRHADNLSGSWDTDQITSSSPSYSTRIAIAADDTIYISYGYNAYYASAPNTTSSVTTYDAYGVPTTSTGHTWSTNTSSVSGSVQYPALALDASENPFLIYYDSYNKDLKFASTDSQWNIGTYDGYSATSSGTGQIGKYSSLATNGSSAYVSYYDAVDRELEMSVGTVSTSSGPPSSWTTRTIDTVPANVGQYTSIAVDGSSNYYISYYDVSNKDAEFYSSVTTSTITYDSYGRPVTSSSTTAAQQTIESANDQGSYSQMAVDSSGYSHVVYYDATNFDLKYATNESGSWVTEIVDGSTTSVGMYMDIAVDDDDFVHISYYNITGGGKLKYATNESGSWQTEFVDSTGLTGQWSSIDVDSTGVVHIAYHYYTGKDLKYATGNYGSWTKTSVDTTGDVGLYASLAIDSSDQVHISYYDTTNTDLKYATDSDGDGVFETETVDSSANNVGQYSSIAIYNSTTPVIVYYDATAQDLRMAVSP